MSRVWEEKYQMALNADTSIPHTHTHNIRVVFAFIINSNGIYCSIKPLKIYVLTLHKYISFVLCWVYYPFFELVMFSTTVVFCLALPTSCSHFTLSISFFSLYTYNIYKSVIVWYFIRNFFFVFALCFLFLVRSIFLFCVLVSGCLFRRDYSWR